MHPRLSTRIDRSNPDHHLWLNNGTWFVHYTVHRPDFSKQRVRASLGTKSLDCARARRDRLFRDAVGGGTQPQICERSAPCGTGQ